MTGGLRRALLEMRPRCFRATVLALMLAASAAPAALAGPITARGQPPEPPSAPPPGPVVHAPAPRARFLAIGDLPYRAAETVQLQQLLGLAGAGGAPFVLHVGDIKGGVAPCIDEVYGAIADQFRAAPVPVLFTPGDNEWTDCRRQLAGGHDPLERLALLRRVLFADPSVLHQGALGPVVPDPAYPENVYLLADGLLIALVHVVGSENNHRPGDALAVAEFQARSIANRRPLEQATAAAVVVGAQAMIIAFHANPLFERKPPLPGFEPLFQDLTAVLAGFAGPVLVIHGDTHRFRFEQPWRTQPDPARQRLWRLEVPGSPFPGGVWVDVDAGADRPFRVEVVYPVSREDAHRGPLSGLATGQRRATLEWRRAREATPNGDRGTVATARAAPATTIAQDSRAAGPPMRTTGHRRLPGTGARPRRARHRPPTRCRRCARSPPGSAPGAGSAPGSPRSARRGRWIQDR